MNVEDAEYDVLLGGTENLPAAVNISKFVAFRSQEIQVMKNALTAETGTKLAFQTLPKHMRRRAMSHNVKRLPRRLRQIHLRQMQKSGMPVSQKRPSRKYRRRARNLEEEYTKRSLKYRWLPTHIWHAKRFKIVQKWGYKLPYSACDKAFRACYRAVAQHCLIQDISYIRCIEISGNRNSIIDKLKCLYNPSTGLSFGAKAFINGTREGQITLFKAEKVIGPVTFQWQPNGGDTSSLWLWIHPSFYAETKDTLLKSLELQLTPQNLFCYWNTFQTIFLRELFQDLSRIRLTGPLSTAVLQDTFILPKFDSQLVKQPLLNQYIKNDGHRNVIDNQFMYWKNLEGLTSPSEMTPNLIISLLVRDPRLNLPKKRTKSVQKICNSVEMEISHQLADSPLWNESLRKESIQCKSSDAEIINFQGSMLIPTSEVQDVGECIPVILIQRPGNRKDNLGFGSGWDVVLPSVWTKPFWIGMIMRGARAGGLRESESILFEMGKPQYLQPDTTAGAEEERQISQENKIIFFKKPPNKRTNYNKFKITSALQWRWNFLLQEWNAEHSPVDNFVVLRDLELLRTIDDILQNRVHTLPNLPHNCLIPVTLKCKRKGALADFAIICLPNSGLDLKCNVEEPRCIDKYQEERRKLRQSHSTLLKKLKRQRKTKLKNKDNLPEVHQQALENYTKKMRSLWLPQPETIRNSCSRPVIGFVRKGAFSFSQATSCGTGFIAANCMEDLVKLQLKNVVLVRNPNSRQYRPVIMNVIIDQS